MPENEDLLIYGENHEQHAFRTRRAMNELPEAIRKDASTFPSYRLVSSTRMLEAVIDIELEAQVKSNPNTTPEQKAEFLAILKRIQDSEAQSRRIKR